ncbi:MAG: SDR family NAD(P)-dependent oxidoreductase [Ardenticatenaceae bacterium]|nr:SDR family NAD(P)-dependent oxidoreductase [Ardenticatenaceae bacterium]
MSEISFEGRVVVITGAGGGLGAAYARLFAVRGAQVVVHDAGVNRDGSGGDPAPARAVAEEIMAAGGQAAYEIQNLGSKEGCEALIDSVLRRFERIDVLVHSAGLVAYDGIETTSDETWERLRAVNIDAPFWLCRAVWPHMKKMGAGRIVLTVSGYGLKAFRGSDVTAYGVGKGAQFGLMNGLAGEGMDYNIKVNAISPVAATRIFRREVGPDELRPESVAPAVVWLGSDQCTWTGKVVSAAGGRFSLGEFGAQDSIESDPYLSPEQFRDEVVQHYG